MRRLRLLSGSIIFHFVLLSFVLTCVIPPGAWAAPSIQITSPSDDGTVWGESLVDVSFSGEPGAPVYKILLFQDGKQITEWKLPKPLVEGRQTFKWKFSMTTGQTHVIAAKAIDTVGGEKSTTITVKVQKAALGSGGGGAKGPDQIPPVVNILYPQQGAEVKGIIKIRAAAKDDTCIASVFFYVDGKIKEIRMNAPPYETELDTTKLAEGPHMLQATAYDQADNLGKSAEVTIVVQNHEQMLTTGGESVGWAGPVMVDPNSGNAGGIDAPPPIDIKTPPPPGQSGASPKATGDAGWDLAAATMGLPTWQPEFRIPVPGRAVSGEVRTIPVPRAPGLESAASGLITPPPSRPDTTTPGLSSTEPRVATLGAARTTPPPTNLGNSTPRGATLTTRSSQPPPTFANVPPTPRPSAPAAGHTGASLTEKLVDLVLEPLRLMGIAPPAEARTAVPGEHVAGLSPAPTAPVARAAGVGAAAETTYGAATAWDAAWGTPILTVQPSRTAEPPEETRVAGTTPAPTRPVAPATLSTGAASSASGPGLQPMATPGAALRPAGARSGLPGASVAMTPPPAPLVKPAAPVPGLATTPGTVRSGSPSVPAGSGPVGSRTATPGTQIALTPGMQPPPPSATSGPAVADNVPSAIAHIRNIQVVFNGKQLDLRALPAVLQGISMGPLREIFEHTNGILYWYPEDKRVEASNADVKLKLQIGSTEAEVNGEARSLALAPYVKQGRTMVPLQFLADALNVTIAFNPDSGQIVISSNAF